MAAVSAANEIKTMNLDEQIYLRTEQIESKTTELKEAVRQVAKIENDIFSLKAEPRQLRQREREQTERQIAEAKANPYPQGRFASVEKGGC